MGEEYLSAIRRAFLWDPHLAPLVAMRAEEYLNGTRAQDALLEELALPFQDERNKTWLTCLIQHTASYKKRTQYLAPLVHHGLVCAGDASGWRHALGPLVKTLGDLNYRRDLAQHYRNCKVNLNLTSCQMPQTVNQRIFDVPLAGSFLLTDRQSDLSELFDPSELATFQSPEELCEKSLWFQEHAVEREQISALARKRILGEHTYMHRLRQIQPN
jgi:spore maturation protein CgeB